LAPFVYTSAFPILGFFSFWCSKVVGCLFLVVNL
jgi:hypothetical protein